MTRPRSVSHFVFWSAIATLSFAGCGSSGSEVTGNAGRSGTGGRGQAGTGGTTGTGGTIGTGGTTATGSGGSGGIGTTGSGGSGGGRGGSGGSIGGGGGRGGAGAGGTGAVGTGGTGTGGTGTGGTGGGAGGGTGMSAGCGKTPTIPSSMYNNGQHIAITVANMQREYILNVPTNYDNTHPYKLVIAYHELNGNDDEMFRNSYYHLLPLSNNSTIFIAPNGQQGNRNCTAAAGCGWPNPSNSDLLFADAVVAQIEQNFCVDTNRIFATGWSFGGSMSYKTACERPLGGTTAGVPGFVRAIAVYSGSQLSGNCTPTNPVAYYASHGTTDSVLCYDATRVNGCQVGNGVSLAQNFALANGCTWMTPTKVTSGNHVCTSLMGCRAGYPLEFCSFAGDHTPDPRDPGQPTSWEYQNVWTFFSQF
jgi:poly(3-hydroxybutyrate) depolymerase